MGLVNTHPLLIWKVLWRLFRTSWIWSHCRDTPVVIPVGAGSSLECSICGIILTRYVLRILQLLVDWFLVESYLVHQRVCLFSVSAKPKWWRPTVGCTTITWCRAASSTALPTEASPPPRLWRRRPSILGRLRGPLAILASRGPTAQTQRRRRDTRPRQLRLSTVQRPRHSWGMFINEITKIYFFFLLLRFFRYQYVSKSTYYTSDN